MAKALEKEGKIAAECAVYAEHYAQHVISEFDSRFAKYVYGPKWVPLDENGEPMYERQGEGGEGEKIKEGWDQTTYPLHGIQRNVMLPYLISHDPVFLNDQRKGASALERAQVDLYGDVADVIWKESETTFEVQRALDDAYCYRVGWCKTFYDFKEKLPFHKWVDARDMLIDCESKSPKLTDRRWVGEKMVVSIETARWFADEVWNVPKHEFEGVSFEQAHDTAFPSASARGAHRSRTTPEDSSPTKFVRLLLMQVKGANPWTHSASMKAKANTDPAGKTAMYDGEDHVLVLEACGGYANHDGYRVVARIDEWPFPCRRGEFTYTPFVLTRDNRSVYPYNIMQPGHSSQLAADQSIQAYNTDLRNSGRRWGAYNPSAFADEAEAERILNGDAALLIAKLNGQSDPSRAIAIGNFGSPNQSLNLGFALNRENYEAVEGMNKFDVQVRANQTALNTSVQNEAAQVKIESLSVLVTRGVTRLAEKGVMCARANMKLEDIRHWVKSIPDEVDGEMLERTMTRRNGQSVTVNDIWQDKPDYDAIRRETVVNLDPRSVRFKNNDREAQDITELMKFQTEISRIIGDTIGKGGVGAARDIARRYNAAVEMVAKLKNITNYERILFDVEAMVAPEPPPPPQLDPNQLVNAAVKGGAINPAQQGATTRLENQGVDVSTLPPDVGGGV